jgi:hypothetical protein
MILKTLFKAIVKARPKAMAIRLWLVGISPVRGFNIFITIISVTTQLPLFQMHVVHLKILCCVFLI